MKFEILVSCLNQNISDIINNSNIQTNCVIVNQCNVDKINLICNINKFGFEYNVLQIYNSSRGLSRSRNLAIQKATADICMIADDDQLFDDDIEKSILKAYEDIPDADIIIFEARYKSKQISNKIKKLNFIDLFKVSSVQISFRLSSIKNKIYFDTKLGAGTENGAGEENKFLLDCYKKGLKIYFYPKSLFSMRKCGESTWFKGFNTDFFYKRGMVARYTLGLFLTLIYIPYYILTKRNRIECSLKDAVLYSFKGCFENKLKE